MKRMLLGSERELTTRFAALANHYLFEPCFARPATGHDKGGVEARAKGIRWQHLVPIPAGHNLESISRAQREVSVWERAKIQEVLLAEDALTRGPAGRALAPARAQRGSVGDLCGSANRDFGEEQTTYRQILVEFRPMDADALTDQSVGRELGFRGVAELGEPFEGHDNRATILETHS